MGEEKRSSLGKASFWIVLLFGAGLVFLAVSTWLPRVAESTIIRTVESVAPVEFDMQLESIGLSSSSARSVSVEMGEISARVQDVVVTYNLAEVRKGRIDDVWLDQPRVVFPGVALAHRELAKLLVPVPAPEAPVVVAEPMPTQPGFVEPVSTGETMEPLPVPELKEPAVRGIAQWTSLIPVDTIRISDGLLELTGGRRRVSLIFEGVFEQLEDGFAAFLHAGAESSDDLMIELTGDNTSGRSSIRLEGEMEEIHRILPALLTDEVEAALATLIPIDLRSVTIGKSKVEGLVDFEDLEIGRGVFMLSGEKIQVPVSADLEVGLSQWNGGLLLAGQALERVFLAGELNSLEFGDFLVEPSQFSLDLMPDGRVELGLPEVKGGQDDFAFNLGGRIVTNLEALTEGASGRFSVRELSQGESAFEPFVLDMELLGEVLTLQADRLIYDDMPEWTLRDLLVKVPDVGKLGMDGKLGTLTAQLEGPRAPYDSSDLYATVIVEDGNLVLDAQLQTPTESVPGVVVGAAMGSKTKTAKIDAVLDLAGLVPLVTSLLKWQHDLNMQGSIPIKLEQGEDSEITVRSRFQQLTAASIGMGLDLSGVSGWLTFAMTPFPKSVGDQLIRVERLTVGDLMLEDTILEWKLAHMHSLNLKKFESKVLGGRLSIDPFEFDPMETDVEITVRFSNVDASLLTSLFPDAGFAVEGRIDGYLPIKITKDRALPMAGNLELKREGVRRIRLTDESLVKDAFNLGPQQLGLQEKLTEAFKKGVNVDEFSLVLFDPDVQGEALRMNFSGVAKTEDIEIPVGGITLRYNLDSRDIGTILNLLGVGGGN